MLKKATLLLHSDYGCHRQGLAVRCKESDSLRFQDCGHFSPLTDKLVLLLYCRTGKKEILKIKVEEYSTMPS